jgi:hypothetical protein
VRPFEELEAEHGEEFGTVYAAQVEYRGIEADIVEELRRGIDSGEGLDGRAAEMVALMLNLPGEDYTDGECLDLVGFVIDRWRELDL